MKFKPGDTVVVVNPLYPSQNKYKGKIGTVYRVRSNISNDFQWVYFKEGFDADSRNGNLWFDFELELAGNIIE